MYLEIKILPVLEGVEPSRDALDPPLSILVGVKYKLDGRLHLELLLQSKQMLLPGTTALGEQHHLPTGIYLETRGEPEKLCVTNVQDNGQKRCNRSFLCNLG